MHHVDPRQINHNNYRNCVYILCIECDYILSRTPHIFYHASYCFRTEQKHKLTVIQAFQWHQYRAYIMTVAVLKYWYKNLISTKCNFRRWLKSVLVYYITSKVNYDLVCHFKVLFSWCHSHICYYQPILETYINHWCKGLVADKTNTQYISQLHRWKQFSRQTNVSDQFSSDQGSSGDNLFTELRIIKCHRCLVLGDFSSALSWRY